MGHHLAKAALLVGGLGGCSLIYSPSQLPDPVDAHFDTPLQDGDPSRLILTDVSPRVLLEGTGDGGSRQAVVVVSGMFIEPGAVVTITAHAGERAPVILVDGAKAEVATDRNQIAVPVTLPVDMNIGPGKPVKSIRLDVTVTQAPPNQSVTATLSEVAGGPALTLQGLDELVGSPMLDTATVHEYSQVNVAAISASDIAGPLVIRATSSIDITGAASVSGNSANGAPGPGGNPGGPGGAGLVGGDGFAGTGQGAGQPNGGGGGFGTQGVAGPGAGGNVAGTATLATFGSTNRGSGGAGNKGPLIAGTGGKGGGGGGSIEISAGGNLKIDSVTARGANGQPSGGSTGGGGSGGAVLLRAGGTVMVTGTGVNAKGGAGTNATTGTGGDGRVRFDLQDRAAVIASSPAAGYRGPMFASNVPMIVRSAMPTLNVVGQPMMAFSYNILDEAGTHTRGPVTVMMSSSGDLAMNLVEPLFPGFNRVCLVVAAGSADVAEAQNCITIAYLNMF